MSFFIFEHPILSQILSLEFLAVFFQAWYLPPPRAAFVPMALPLPPAVQEILEIIVPAPTQIIKLNSTRTQLVFNLASSSSTTVQDFVGPFRFAAIAVIAAGVSYVLIAVAWSMIEKAISYWFGKPAKGDLPRKSWSVLSFVLITFRLLFGPLKRGLDTAFPAVAWGVHWRTLALSLCLPVIIKYLVGPFGYTFYTASTCVASGVQWIQELFSPFKNELRIILPHIAGWILAAVIGHPYQNTRHSPGSAKANVSHQDATSTTRTAGHVHNQAIASGNDASTEAPSFSVHFPIPALVRRPLELLQAARSYAHFIYNAPRLFHELEDRLIHKTHQAEMAQNAEMGVRHMYQEQARELHRVRRQLSDHVDDLHHARSYCHDLEERNALLEEEARDGVTSEEAPPNYEQALREGAFDEWSAAVVSGAATFAPPHPSQVGEPPTCEYTLPSLPRTRSHHRLS
ncbi:hypothetical protein DXG01_001393 [Tephrocybe rancida]|nr:hypothetical protein DXG01_001393 [Tephrocybe rancida]